MRRYFMPEEEGEEESGCPPSLPLRMKHFDVSLPKDQQNQEGPADYLRFYYCDFLNAQEHEESLNGLREAWEKKKEDAKLFFEWISHVQPRAKTDAYPLFLIVQEMLRLCLHDKLEMQLAELSTAQETIEMMDGNTVELNEKIERLEEELEITSENLKIAREDLDKERNLNKALQTELEDLRIQVKSQDTESRLIIQSNERLAKTLKETGNKLEKMNFGELAFKSKLHAMDKSLEAERSLVLDWHDAAEHAIAQIKLGINDDGKQSLHLEDAENAAYQASHEALVHAHLMLQFSRFANISEIEGQDQLDDSHLQKILQLVPEMIACVLQIKCAYLAERMHQTPVLNEKLKLGKSERRLDRASEEKFLYVAASSANSFLVGEMLPRSSITYSHFVNEKKSKPLVIFGPESSSQLHRFNKTEEDGDKRSCTYIAVPVFNQQGTLCAFVAVDSLQIDSPVPDLNVKWKIDFLRSIAKFLGKAYAMHEGLGYDLESCHGPVHYAKRMLEVTKGVPVETLADYDEIIFEELDAPLISSLAERGQNMFGYFKEEILRRRYFVNTVSELYSAKVEDLVQLKRAMEDETFNHQYNKRRLRSCVHIPSPPPETIKVWKAVLILLKQFEEQPEKLEAEPMETWSYIRGILIDERHSRDKLSVLIESFDPTKTHEESFDRRYDLTLRQFTSIRHSALLREGFPTVFLYEWVYITLWICTLSKEMNRLQAEG
ncbi:hypothetical protein GUITHDRAFT_108683 [Guillardia theta CCMP2712]|uniref:GAF domain-containing protein n=3 Tax=Guillardia theta TaxID=55529 RepID=L1JA69_GUITC|nr:hypothetical protein GUITHDRAFT_108683 [Guillardia theta CCMP2712]EKX45416.1 hypothetical protein GUITHDRAFT_108683 [Guillardia theta CCMP2712]|eukprot:XP_005832396.1 hypothetical protein GUITHDRAFT_108683 [Guillardia theta CCMP2712]